MSSSPAALTPRGGLSRRALLRGAGGVTLALPFLDAMEGTAAAAPVPKRFVVWFTPNGFCEAGFPKDMSLTGTSFEPLAPFRDDLIVTRGLSMVSARLQSTPDHPTGFGHLLTGDVCKVGPGDDVHGGNVSVDQFLAGKLGRTRFAASLHGINARRTLSWARSAAGAVTPVMPDNDPGAVFDRLFASGLPREASSDPAATARRGLLRQRSILDAVRGSYADLACRLGQEDRRRLEAHAEGIRAVEQRLLDDEGGTAGRTCGSPPGRPAALPYTAGARGRDVGRLHMQLLVKALECDLTRVGTIQWYAHTGLYAQAYGWDGLESHHEASHNNRHAAHDRVFARELAHFLGLLKQARAEDGRSLLHHTAVLCVTELGINRNLHHLADLGVLVAGQAGGVLRTGRYIDFLAPHRGSFQRAPDWKRAQDPAQYFRSFDVPHNRLLVELCNAVLPPTAAPVSTFGAAGLGAGGLPPLRG